MGKEKISLDFPGKVDRYAPGKAYCNGYRIGFEFFSKRLGRGFELLNLG